MKTKHSLIPMFIGASFLGVPFGLLVASTINSNKKNAAVHDHLLTQGHAPQQSSRLEQPHHYHDSVKILYLRIRQTIQPHGQLPQEILPSAAAGEEDATIRAIQEMGAIGSNTFMSFGDGSFSFPPIGSFSFPLDESFSYALSVSDIDDYSAEYQHDVGLMDQGEEGGDNGEQESTPSLLSLPKQYDMRDDLVDQVPEEEMQDVLGELVRIEDDFSFSYGDPSSFSYSFSMSFLNEWPNLLGGKENGINQSASDATETESGKPDTTGPPLLLRDQQQQQEDTPAEPSGTVAKEDAGSVLDEELSLLDFSAMSLSYGDPSSSFSYSFSFPGFDNLPGLNEDPDNDNPGESVGRGAPTESKSAPLLLRVQPQHHDAPNMPESTMDVVEENEDLMDEAMLDVSSFSYSFSFSFPGLTEVPNLDEDEKEKNNNDTKPVDDTDQSTVPVDDTDNDNSEGLQDGNVQPEEPVAEDDTSSLNEPSNTNQGSSPVSEITQEKQGVSGGSLAILVGGIIAGLAVVAFVLVRH